MHFFFGNKFNIPIHKTADKRRFPSHDNHLWGLQRWFSQKKNEKKIYISEWHWSGKKKMPGVRGQNAQTVWKPSQTCRRSLSANTHTHKQLPPWGSVNRVRGSTKLKGRMLSRCPRCQFSWLAASHQLNVSRKWRNHAPLAHSHTAHWLPPAALQQQSPCSAAKAIGSGSVSGSCRGGLEESATVWVCTWSPSNNATSANQVADEPAAYRSSAERGGRQERIFLDVNDKRWKH